MISVVVTLYNESASLDELYRRTAASLEALGDPFEVVFVDDGSTGGCGPSASAATSASIPRCTPASYAHKATSS